MGLISYLSYGWNKLFSIPAVTQQQIQDLKELNETIIAEVAKIILLNDYMQHQSPRDWQEVVFTRQYKEQFTDQIADRLVEVFSKAAYKPQSGLEAIDILMQQIPKGIRQAKFIRAGQGIELKALHAHDVLSELVWIQCNWYAINWFTYHTLVDPTCVYDEKQLNELFSLIENRIELSMRDVADCINGIGVGYLIQAGLSRDFTSIVAEPIDFEEIVKIDVSKALTMNTMPRYFTKLQDKVPERLSNYTLMIRECKKIFEKVQNMKELAQHIEINKFIKERIIEIREKVFYPRSPIIPVWDEK